MFSVEHPIYTARAEQDWFHGAGGERLHWPLDHYRAEGLRRVHWMGAEMGKFHRTVETYVNTLIDFGFRIRRIAGPEPPPALVRERPDLADERRRPMVLLAAAVKEG